MKDVMGVIYTGENDARLRELTMTRAIAALPVAGRYSVIDFLVSSMVNARMRNVGVIMQKNYHSLMDHLGSGKEWDLHGKNDGLYLLPPFLTRENVGVYNGLLDALRSNTNYLSRSKQEYVVLSGSNMIYNADMRSFNNVVNSPAYYIHQNDYIYVEPNKKRANESTVNGNTVQSASFWISIVSLLASLASTTTLILTRTR